MDDETLAIPREFLDRMSDALFAGDAGTFVRHLHLPHGIMTENGIIEMEIERRGGNRGVSKVLHHAQCVAWNDTLPLEPTS